MRDLNPSAITIIGLDPGTARVGFGAIVWNGCAATMVEAGTITTPADQSPAERLRIIHTAIDALFHRIRPDRVAVEKLYFTKNVKTAMSVAQARGTLLERISAHHVPCHEYTPNEIKLALTGYGNATKRQVQSMVQRILSLSEPPASDDAADALAAAICCAHTGSGRGA